MLVELLNGIGFWSKYFIGLDSTIYPNGSNKYILLLNNVEMFYSNYCNKIAVAYNDTIQNGVTTRNRTLYYWGKSDYGLIGNSQETPTTILPTGLSSLDKLVGINGGWRITYIWDSDGKIWSEGINRTNLGINGLGVEKPRDLTQIASDKFNDEKVVDVVSCSTTLQATIVLTDEGNLYGWGLEDYIGKGATGNYQQTPINLEPSFLDGSRSIVSITGGEGFFVVTCNDGTVWGIGDNSSGILGRWRGVERGDSNSKYRSAFSWVECPDLEN